MAVLETTSGGGLLDGASPFGITDFPFTYACWVKRKTGGADGQIMSIGHSTGTTNVHTMYITSTNRAGVRTRCNNTTAEFSNASTDYIISNSVWEPVVVVFTAANSRTLYKGAFSTNNTTNISCFESGTNLISSSSGRFSMGRSTHSTTRWDGYIAHAAVWDKALTTNEVSSFLGGGNPLTIANEIGNQHLQGYWAEDFFEFPEGEGAWYYEDKSKNDNHLALEANAVRSTETGPTVDDPPSTGLAFTVAPTVTSRTTNSYTIGGTLSESGDVFAVAILPEATDPTTPAQIIAGTDGTGAAARGTGQQLGVTNFSFNITGTNLSNNPTHDIFVVGRKQT